MKEDLLKLKEDVSRKGFWLIQLLNMVNILKYIALVFMRAACWKILINLFFSDMQLPSETKIQFLLLFQSLWFALIPMQICSSAIRNRLKWPDSGSSCVVFVMLSGFNAGSYTDTNLSSLIEQYLPIFVSAAIFSLIVRYLVKWVFEKSVTPDMKKDHSIRWHADSWINPYLDPIVASYKHRFSKPDRIEVEFGLRYSFCKFSVGMFAAVPLE